MFTGIITSIGTIREVRKAATSDLEIVIRSGAPLREVEIGASIACSGVCLTVTAFEEADFTVSLSAETVARTVPGMWKVGGRLNLERALRVGDELGGHIVTGHVDGVGTVRQVEAVESSRHLVIGLPPALVALVAGKGSIAVDGVSLTVNAVEDRAEGSVFHVNIIEHTAAETTLAALQPGAGVNLEIDILARYLARMQNVGTLATH